MAKARRRPAKLYLNDPVRINLQIERSLREWISKQATLRNMAVTDFIRWVLTQMEAQNLQVEIVNKQCLRCKRTLLLDQFDQWYHKQGKRIQVRGICKDCCNSYRKEAYSRKKAEERRLKRLALEAEGKRQCSNCAEIFLLKEDFQAGKNVCNSCRSALRRERYLHDKSTTGEKKKTESYSPELVAELERIKSWDWRDKPKRAEDWQ